MGKILNAITAHSKTITSLCRDASATHLLSGSLDRSVKAYELSTGQVVGVIKYDAPVLCIALSPMNTHLVAGTTDSCLTVRRKKVGQANASASAAGSSGEKDPLALSAFGKPGQVAPVSAGATGTADDGPRPGTYRYFLRGRRHAAQSGDVVVNKPNSAKLAGFDKALKRFRYHDALDAALADGSPEVVVSVVEELVQRNGLRISLQGRDQSTLQPLIGFLARQITQPPWAPTLIGVANLLLDMYAPVLGQSAAIDELFQKLRGTVESEMRLQAELAQLLGAMDVLLAGAAQGDVPPPKKVARLPPAPTAAAAAGGAASSSGAAPASVS